jgi:hypothetical protein
MNRRSAWLPALAAPIALLGHLLPEALVSGRPLLALAEEPVHLALLGLSLGALPLWFRAARSRRLGLAIFGFIAVTLLAEGNGLSAAALLVALAISAIISCLGGLALEAAVETAAGPSLVALTLTAAKLPALVECAGPYFAYVPSRGNRPPPPLLASRAFQTAFV